MVTLSALTWIASVLPKAGAPPVILTPSMTAPAPVISNPPVMTDSAPRVPVPVTPWLAPRMVTARSRTMFSL